MDFNVSTKPLMNALDLGVIKQNISKFYHKSCLAQLTITRQNLRINLESANIKTELILKGSGSEDSEATVFVDCLLLQQLISTFTSNIVKLVVAEDGLVIHSGSSKFVLPKLVDGSEIELTRPVSNYSGETIPLNKEDWKFVKDHQMYAIAMSFIHPVYTRVWVGEAGDVLVGDFDNSLFTQSHKGNFGETCLLSDTIINLFNSLPEGASIIRCDGYYIISVNTDSYSYLSEFRPMHEEDDGVGSYNSDIILGMMNKSAAPGVDLDVAAVNRFLNQASLLSSSSEDTIQFSVSSDKVSLSGNNVDCKFDIDPYASPFTVEFKTSSLKDVLSNFDSEAIKVAPMMQEGQVAGILLWSDNLTVVLASVEE